jgi:hypothetical protein
LVVGVDTSYQGLTAIYLDQIDVTLVASQ